MAKIQMVQKIIIVALLITVSLAEETAINTPQILNPLKSINQSKQTIKQATSQQIASKDNTDNALISDKIEIKVPEQLQEGEKKEISLVQDNNQTSVVQNGKQEQNVEIEPKKISENDPNTNETDKILPGNLTLELLSKKQEKVDQINQDQAIEADINKEQSKQSNISVQIKSLEELKQSQTLPLNDENLQQISNQLPIEDKNDISSLVTEEETNQTETSAIINETVFQQTNQTKADDQAIQKDASSSIITLDNTNNQSQTPVSSLQTKTKESQTLSLSSQQVPKQPTAALLSDIKNNDSSIITSNQTIISVESIAIKADQASQEQKQPSSNDIAITIANNSQISEKIGDINSQIEQTVEKNIAIADNITTSLNLQQNQDQEQKIAASQTANKTVLPQSQQKIDDNIKSENKTQQQEETTTNNTSIQTDNKSKDQTTSIQVSSNSIQKQNPTIQPIQEINNQIAKQSQQKSQKQVKTVNKSIQIESNYTKKVLFSGKLPQQMRKDTLLNKKIEEVGKVLKQNKEKGNLENEIVDKFMLQTDVDASTSNTDSSVIPQKDNLHQEVSEVPKVVNAQSLNDVLANNETDDKQQSSIIAKDGEGDENFTSKVIEVDKSSQINSKQSNITAEVKQSDMINSEKQQSLTNQNELQKQATQISSITANDSTSTKINQKIAQQTKIEIEDSTTASNNISGSTSPVESMKDEDIKTTQLIQDETNSTSTSIEENNTQILQNLEQSIEQPSQTTKQPEKEVNPTDNSSIIQEDINITASQTPVSTQNTHEQTKQQLKTSTQNIESAVKQKIDQGQASKSHEFNDTIEQNNIVDEKATIGQTQKQQNNIEAKKVQTQTRIESKIIEKQGKKAEEHKEDKQPSQKEEQQETPSLNIFEFKQQKIIDEKAQESKQETKQKSKNTISPKKPFKLHAQQLNNQRAAKKKQQENSKQPHKIDQFKKENNQLIEELAKQKKALDKKLTQNKPKQTPIIIEKKQKLIQQKQASSNNEIYVIVIFMIIGILVIHFLIKAFCVTKKKQATKSQSSQNLSEEDEDFDLSCPDMAERLEEDY